MAVLPYSLIGCLVLGLAAQDLAPKLDVPYVATPQFAVTAMLEVAKVTKSDIVYDLGCGDGRIAITAAKDFGAHAVCIDIDPERVVQAFENAKAAGVEKLIDFQQKDLFQAGIHNATVVALYLLPRVNVKLRPKLLQELKPGTRIVSHSFDMGDWKPHKLLALPGAVIYFWTIPSK